VIAFGGSKFRLPNALVRGWVVRRAGGNDVTFRSVFRVTYDDVAWSFVDSYLMTDDFLALFK
jgi:hypothetical protein